MNEEKKVEQTKQVKTGKKVLLIEDDRYISRAYQDGLERAGFQVSVSLDGREGMKSVKADKPDLILLDLIMPIQNGFEFLEEIKMSPEFKKIPVIILSNLGQDSDIQKGKALGVDEYLIKANFSMKEVIEKVKFHLAKTK